MPTATCTCRCTGPTSFIAGHRTDSIDILAEDFEGTLIAAPTNIAFCGRNRDVLLSTNLGRWHITRYDAGVAGHPLNYPDIG